MWNTRWLRRNIVILWIVILGGIYLGCYVDYFKLFSTHNALFDTKEGIPEEHTGPQFHLWLDDPQCAKYVTTLGHDLPTVYLISFPRSGNAWARYLMEGATGIFTGSVYNSTFIVKYGYLGERQDHRQHKVLLVKSHEVPSIKDLNNFTTPVIFLMRNPAASIFSFWSYMSAVKSNQSSKIFFYNADLKSYDSHEFKKHVSICLQTWLKLYTFILEKQRNLHVLFYENLIKDPLKEVRRMLTYLKRPVDEDRMKCLAAHVNGPAKRLHTYEVNPFSENQMKSINRGIQRVKSLLIKRGIEIPTEFLTSFN